MNVPDEWIKGRHNQWQVRLNWAFSNVLLYSQLKKLSIKMKYFKFKSLKTFFIIECNTKSEKGKAV